MSFLSRAQIIWSVFGAVFVVIDHVDLSKYDEGDNSDDEKIFLRFPHTIPIDDVRSSKK